MHEQSKGSQVTQQNIVTRGSGQDVTQSYVDPTHARVPPELFKTAENNQEKFITTSHAKLEKTRSRLNNTRGLVTKLTNQLVTLQTTWSGQEYQKKAAAFTVQCIGAKKMLEGLQEEVEEMALVERNKGLIPEGSTGVKETFGGMVKQFNDVVNLHLETGNLRPKFESALKSADTLSALSAVVAEHSHYLLQYSESGNYISGLQQLISQLQSDAVTYGIQWPNARAAQLVRRLGRYAYPEFFHEQLMKAARNEGKKYEKTCEALLFLKELPESKSLSVTQLIENFTQYEHFAFRVRTQEGPEVVTSMAKIRESLIEVRRSLRFRIDESGNYRPNNSQLVQDLRQAGVPNTFHLAEIAAHALDSTTNRSQYRDELRSGKIESLTELQVLLRLSGRYIQLTDQSGVVTASQLGSVLSELTGKSDWQTVRGRFGFGQQKAGLKDIRNLLAARGMPVRNKVVEQAANLLHKEIRASH
ncbi:hypothetical protein KBC79_06695 [Candidatus Woesebacteria bacterium]|nr:hypothetical protein [Candidatus Woesebacteria bacterium]